MLKWLQRRRSARDGEVRAAVLYDDLVGIARRPDWYESGGVPDSVDGRFDMVILALSLMLVRLERDEADPRARALSSLLVERFAADMDGSFREIGVGDMVIGKHMGHAMQALGGRLGSYRDALAADADPALLRAALARNLLRGEDVATDRLDRLEQNVRDEWARLVARPLSEILAEILAENRG
ncbi:ubiquinol-cytochrome C chaperone family protein [Sphingosinicella soli]|uniref:Cytochrome b pre-mRNA-processing protein 3 n=1 Tax=Sphingosinicella soli TaxID=333708 RepID=A0A7W7F7A4_9SPHN|nr:ubiquinol-cytochrome C chaperone family protein [Sphingosinicella soli]MBB4632479.1 cytochrome b pre-mRNA-processing protein 3 [Sphingosinicella soli]